MKGIDLFKLYTFSNDKLLEKLIIAGDINVSFSFVSDFMVSKVFRDIINSIGDLVGLNGKCKNRIVSVIDELANNAIEHGSKSGDINKLRIVMKKKKLGLFLNIEIEDSGNGKNKKTAADMLELKKVILERGFNGHKSIRGRGLFMIIINLVDELYFKDSDNGGLIVGVNKTLGPKGCLS